MTKILWILGMACLVMVQAATNDRGPQRFTVSEEQESPSVPPQNLPGFIMEDVTLYLTPSQVRALEASREENQQSGAQELSEQEALELEEEIRRQLEQQNVYINDQGDIERPVPPPQIQESTDEEPPVIIPRYQQKWAPKPNPPPQIKESTEEEPPVIIPRYQPKLAPKSNSPPQINESTDEEPPVIIPRYQPKLAPKPKTQKTQKYYSPSEEFVNQKPSPKSPKSYSFANRYTNVKVQDSNANYKIFGVQREPLRSKEYKYIPYSYFGDYTTEAPQPEEVKEEKKERKTPYSLNVKVFRNPQVTEEPKEESKIPYTLNVKVFRNPQITEEPKEESKTPYTLNVKAFRNPQITEEPKEESKIPYTLNVKAFRNPQITEEPKEESKTPYTLNVKVFRNPQITKAPKEEDENEQQSPLENEEQSPLENEEQSSLENEEQSPLETEEQIPLENEEQSPVENEQQSPVENEQQSRVGNEQQSPLEREEANLRYTPRYNDQQPGAEYQKFVSILEKEIALARSETFVRSSSVDHHTVITHRRPSNSGYRPLRSGSERSPIIGYVWRH
ncbi:hypothetical protein ABMA28_006199 [Loxostege sticticalis]|uniref:Uncharacterized protein n=1 Tax=Loxostege sticticalis TaxID=481309 RepID=A0ABD0SKD3_LOXSC